jgi:hypothetical protein
VPGGGRRFVGSRFSRVDRSPVTLLEALPRESRGTNSVRRYFWCLDTIQGLCSSCTLKSLVDGVGVTLPLHQAQGENHDQ